MEIILETVLTIAFSGVAICGAAMFLTMLSEDKKRTKYEEERLELERKRYEDSRK